MGHIIKRHHQFSTVIGIFTDSTCVGTTFYRQKATPCSDRDIFLQNISQFPFFSYIIWSYVAVVDVECIIIVDKTIKFTNKE